MERIELGGIALETEITGAGQPLLFLHGGDYVAQNAPFLDRLAQRFRVIAPRHPGFGTTPRPSWFRSVHDIAYLYLDLLDRLDLKDTLLVGSSFGGWIALEMAVRSEARIARLALEDYHYLHSVRGELLRRLGRTAEAGDAYRRALGLVHDDAERRLLERRLAELDPT